MNSTIAIIVAVIALLGTIAKAVGPGLLEDRKSAQERLEHDRGPLWTAALRASGAAPLILADHFTECFIERAGMQQAAVQMTLCGFAQFIAWWEIIGRQLQFLRFRSSSETREVHEMLMGTTETLLDRKHGHQFTICRVGQQGFGERTIEDRDGKLTRSGYGTLLERRKAVDQWLAPLARDLKAIDDKGRTRLIRLQHQLLPLTSTRA